TAFRQTSWSLPWPCSSCWCRQSSSPAIPSRAGSTSADALSLTPCVVLPGNIMHFLIKTAVMATALAVAGVSPAFAADPQKKEIVFGATAGPYSDQIKQGIKPILEKQGYKVRIVEFNDYVQPNFALAEGSLDANAFQHVVYLENFAKKNNLALSELVKVPTAPIAIYSKKFKSLDEAP